MISVGLDTEEIGYIESLCDLLPVYHKIDYTVAVNISIKRREFWVLWIVDVTMYNIDDPTIVCVKSRAMVLR